MELEKGRSPASELKAVGHTLVWSDLNTLDAKRYRLRNSFWAAILAIASSYILASCIFTTTRQRQEINELPGAVIYSGGKSSVSEVYREAAELLGEGNFEEAEVLYRQIIEIEPTNPDGFIGLGGSLLYQDKLEEAEQAYLQALNLSPQSIEALIGLGSVHYLQGDFREADELYSQVLELDGEVPDAHWGKALVLEQQGKDEEAIYHYERFIELAPDSQLSDDAYLRIDELKSETAEE
jgi:tetratricopeptide (TPR) repeat protein